MESPCATELALLPSALTRTRMPWLAQSQEEARPVEPDLPAELSLDQLTATHRRGVPAPSACVAQPAFGP